MGTRMRFGATPVLALLLLGSLNGCLMYRANAVGAAPIEGPTRVENDTTFHSSVTSWSLAWGLLRKGSTRYECDGAGLQEVTVTSPPHYTLLTLVTVGLVSPKRVRVKCAKVTPAGGVFTPGGR